MHTIFKLTAAKVIQHFMLNQTQNKCRVKEPLLKDPNTVLKGPSAGCTVYIGGHQTVESPNPATVQRMAPFSWMQRLRLPSTCSKDVGFQ